VNLWNFYFLEIIIIRIWICVGVGNNFTTKERK